MKIKQKITPFLWFDNQAEEAITFYKSIFKDSAIGDIARTGDGGPGEKGSILTGTFTLAGQQFMAINGGPMFKFTEAISLFVDCKDQDEVDYYWEKLSEGGKKSRCGWLKDKFGLSWQIVPDTLSKVLYGADREGAGRAMQAMMKMDKLIVKDLQDAYDGK
ncbi:VOC family protein [Mucilaginibacter sp. FT3.2]|uniref:VOC family protein n=1 Tax=Mucilaginibacter sp. FT3.2 TaxID=2723090 RepID=UPI00160FDD89|nr:VOC family protein [Mucilaginibacter sp. FT3.2]MBB6232515.1 putative 3-demethylubiquinone-9 3-methyltransferase (glyoxalase superfamily) [Mucilaginibacter sp. FT3.2]